MSDFFPPEYRASHSNNGPTYFTHYHREAQWILSGFMERHNSVVTDSVSSETAEHSALPASGVENITTGLATPSPT